MIMTRRTRYKHIIGRLFIERYMLLFRYALFEACLLARNIWKLPFEYNLNVIASVLLRVMKKLKRLIVFIDGT